MHFAYPPRKSSNPPPYLPPRYSSAFRGLPTGLLRRNRVKLLALIGLTLIGILYIFNRPGNRHGYPAPPPPSGNPPVVIVTVIDEAAYSKKYIRTVMENRRLYADSHGYKVFFPRVGDYDLKGSPSSWTKVVAMRHALTAYPDCTYVWFLDQDAFIMNAQLKVDDFLMKSSSLDSLMIRDMPVVPPDSIIHTFSHLKGADVDFVLTQDREGMSSDSFIVRNGEWTKFFLETWFDPIYRSYNFQKAETHALEHIVQWHPTILSRLAIVPQRTLNSYSNNALGEEYEEGDLVVRFAGCAKLNVEACESDSDRFVEQWRKSMGS